MHVQAKKPIGLDPPYARRRAAERRRAFLRRKVVPWLFVLPIFSSTWRSLPARR